MKRLYVLFDPKCALCQQCRIWLERQSAYIDLRFISLYDSENARRFPGSGSLDFKEKLLVVSDEGAVYQGHFAWIMCLYALREYREWSQRLAHPAFLPLARRLCELVSANRLSLSRLLTKTPLQIAQVINAQPSVLCEAAKCDC